MILLEFPPIKRGARRWSHMISDRPGEEGSRELASMAARIGLKPEWLQDVGKPREHFDIYSRSIIQRAFSLGAKSVRPRQIILAIRAKSGSPRRNQKAWIAAIENAGGLAGVAWNVDDAKKIINPDTEK